MSSENNKSVYGYVIKNKDWEFCEANSGNCLYRSLYFYLLSFMVKNQNSVDLGIFSKVSEFFVRKKYVGGSFITEYYGNYDDNCDRDPWGRQFVVFPNKTYRKLDNSVEKMYATNTGLYRYYELFYDNSDGNVVNTGKTGVIYVYVTSIAGKEIYCVDIVS